MSALSPTPRLEPLTDLFSANGRMPAAGPSTEGLLWSNGGPMLRMEDAVVETVVTHTTRTTTSFAPIPLPRIPPPENITMPYHLSSECYPLAHEATPEDLKIFALNLGGQRVVVQEDGSASAEFEALGQTAGPGWTRTLLGGAAHREDGERIGLVQAFSKVKGKEVRKRPHESGRPASRAGETFETPSLPITGDISTSRQRSSPPRKKIRGLDELAIGHDGSNALLSPLPSPEPEAGPSTASSSSTASPPSVGSGVEVAALFSLPSIVSNFEVLPDKLQQQVLMHLLRRSRMPTIQRISAFASSALKRDFISLLPHEVAVQILKKVDTKSLAAATRVCKRWRKMIDSERAVWHQRLIEDNMWIGLGVEQEEETLVEKRIEILDSMAKAKPSRAGTPVEDEPMISAVSARTLDMERPTPLKHVYRRRHMSSRNWLHTPPEHTSFPGHGTNVVTCLQFDADKIVSASDDHSINVYNTSTGQLRKRLDGHEGGVWALEYKDDTLVSGSTDRTVRIWDLDTLTEAHVFHGHTSTVRCLQIVEPVFDPNTGEYQPPYPMIVTGSRDASLRVWKLPKKGEPPFIKSQFSVSPDAHVPPDENPWHIHHLEGHNLAVRALAAYGRTCVSGSYDCSVRVWDIVTGQCKHILTGHEQKVYSIGYDRHRNRCASGSMDNTVKVWDVATGECLHTLTGHTSLVGLLGSSPNYLVSAAADASLRIWDANSHELKHTLGSHGGAITCFKHDETKVVSGSDGTLKLWDMRTGAYVRDLVIGISSVWQVSFHGNLLVAASNRQGSTVFDVFNFGHNGFATDVDNDELDKLRRPPWERKDPREPQAYQADEMDFEITSPRSATSRAQSVDIDQWVRGNSSSRAAGSRRSSRLREKAMGSSSVRAAYSASYSIEPPPRTKRSALRTEAGSPSPAGPSRTAQMLGLAGESFAPIFDDDKGDEPTDEGDDVVC